MKRKIFAAAGALALLLALGIYGGTECGTIALGRGAAEAVTLMLGGAWALWKAGVVRL